MGEVVVVGAINVDLVVAASRLPGPGETVVGRVSSVTAGQGRQCRGRRGARRRLGAARGGRRRG